MSIKPIPILIPPTPIIYTYTPNSPPPATSKNQASVALSTWALSWQSLAFSLCVWPTLGVDHQWGTTRRSTPSQVRKRFFPKMEKAGLHLFGGEHFFIKILCFCWWCFTDFYHGIHHHQTTIFSELFPSFVANPRIWHPPNRWCGAQSSISQAEAVFPAQSPALLTKRCWKRSYWWNVFPWIFANRLRVGS